MFHPLNRKFIVRVNGHLVENLVVCAKEFIVMNAINAADGLLIENCYF